MNDKEAILIFAVKGFDSTRTIIEPLFWSSDLVQDEKCQSCSAQRKIIKYSGIFWSINFVK